LEERILLGYMQNLHLDDNAVVFEIRERD